MNVAAAGAAARRGAGQQVTAGLRLAQRAREHVTRCLHCQLRGRDDEGAVTTLEGTDAAAGTRVIGEAPQEDKGRQGGACERNDGAGASKDDALSPGTVRDGLEHGWLERATWVRCAQPRGAKGPLRWQWALVHSTKHGDASPIEPRVGVWQPP